MYQVDQVLIPVDFSSFSRCALAFARNLGKESPRLQLAHVIDEWAPHIRNVLFPYAALGEDEVEFEHELIHEAGQHLGRYFRVDKKLEKLFINEPIVRMGKRKPVLSELVRTQDSDLVVMGAFGEGGVYPETLGSMTECVLRSAVQPVVLVRDFERSPTVKHIVVAVDLTPASAEVFGRALGLAIQCGATLEAVYVLPSPYVQDTNKLLENNIKFNPNQALSRSEDKIEALFERLREQVEVPFSLKDVAARLMRKRKVLIGDPATEIVNHAYKTEADLIVVGARNTQSGSNRNLGRVAWTVARSAPTHVMVVPIESSVTLLGGES